MREVVELVVFVLEGQLDIINRALFTRREELDSGSNLTETFGYRRRPLIADLVERTMAGGFSKLCWEVVVT